MPRRARTALIGAGASFALLLVVWALALHTGLGAHADLSIFKGFTGLQRPRVNGLAAFIRDLCDPGPFIVLGAALMAAALARRRPRLAVAIGAFLLGANMTTELVLKPLLASPRLVGSVPIPQGSYPSGHATAAMTLALALVLVVPARRRPLAAAVGAAFAVAVGYSLLMLGSHYPSDILGGFLVAVIWVQLAVAGLSSMGARRAAPPAVDRQTVPVRRALEPSAWAVACATGLTLALVLARPQQAVSYATGHAAFIVGAGAIAVLALVLATSVMLTVRR